MVQLRSVLSPTIVNRFFSAFTGAATLAVILRYCFFDIRDPSKCGALMNEGLWLDHPQNVSDAIPKDWQPPGCMLHSYRSADVSTCFANRRAVFVGDSTVRHVFWAVVRKLDPDANSSRVEKHMDIVVTKGNVRLEFLWDPYLNSSRLLQELDLFEGRRYYGEDASRPAMMFMGTGLWYARYEPVNALRMWRKAVDDVAARMRRGRKSTDLTHQDLLMISPVLVPMWPWLDEARKSTITTDKIEEMNQYLLELSRKNGIDVMASLTAMTDDVPQGYEKDGIHLKEDLLARQADALLNMRCNSVLPPKYPYDKTCCNMYDPPNYQQWIGLVFTLSILPIMSFFRDRAESRGLKPANWLLSEKTTHALLTFSLAAVYCFYADRTQVFNKFHKHYTTTGFFLLTVIWVCLGALSIKRSSTTATDQPFMFRDQTDEWKGWMQFAILVYHYTGASKVAWIYGFIRVTVASYLFMTGYGHTLYFYKKGDYSFKRVVGVLIRLNLLSCVLPYMMKTEYIFYYFAPLVSFWFMVVYFTMRIGAEYNKNTRFLLTKIGISAILVTVITKLPGALEVIFEIPHLLAWTQWNVTEWRFRVFLDIWIVYVGMVVAVVFVKLSDSSSPYSASFPAMRRYAIIAAAVALPLFVLFQTTRENKFVYNAYHPYLSWVPILSYITLRNATPRLRNAYSGIFAWLGKCSLETFTLQFHIWMAADTQGLLDFGLFGHYHRFDNFLIVTPMFLFISHCVAGATGDLTAWIMGTEKKPQQNPTQQLPISNRDVTEADRAKAGEEEEAVLLTSLGGDGSEGGDATRPPERAPESKLTLYFRNLKLRCVVILVGMWIMNVTYTP